MPSLTPPPMTPEVPAALSPLVRRVIADNPSLMTMGATVAGMVAVMNITNFIDGVDGLAAGICTIAAITFGVIALSLDRGPAGILAAITAGAALGFLRHGFHPASIFLGDSGSNLLGYLLAVIAVQGALKTNAVVALSWLAHDLGELIYGLDANPVICGPEGCVAVDALVIPGRT